MPEEGKYLYCIIENSNARNFGPIGMGDRGDEVTTIPYGDLSAVISSVTMRKYVVSRETMMAHEKVLEKVMKDCTVLPVRFYTVAPSADEVRSLLRKRHAEFKNLLRYLDGRAELGLKVLWRDEKAIFQEIVAENRKLRKLRDSLQGKTAEAAHFDRIRLGEMVRMALDQKRDKEANMVLARFRPIANQICENKIMVDRMVLNAAFLVNKSREGECDQMVKRLDEELGERMMFKYTGPNPPYSFVNIVVKE